VVAALVAAVAIDSRSTLAALAFGFGVWLIAGSLSEFASRLRLGRAPLAESMRRLRAMPRAALGNGPSRIQPWLRRAGLGGDRRLATRACRP